MKLQETFQWNNEKKLNIKENQKFMLEFPFDKKIVEKF